MGIAPQVDGILDGGPVGISIGRAEPGHAEGIDLGGGELEVAVVGNRVPRSCPSVPVPIGLYLEQAVAKSGGLRVQQVGDLPLDLFVHGVAGRGGHRALNIEVDGCWRRHGPVDDRVGGVIDERAAAQVWREHAGDHIVVVECGVGVGGAVGAHVGTV